jgi:hypothetical protein
LLTNSARARSDGPNRIMSSMINPMGFASEAILHALCWLKATTEDAVGHRLEDEAVFGLHSALPERMGRRTHLPSM